MHRRLVILMFGGLALALTASVAPAVSNEAPDAATTVAVQRVSAPYPALRDEAAMVLVGTALIGLAAVLRRAA